MLFKIGFGHFLEEDETVRRVFRTPALFMLIRMIISGGIWGTIAFGIWFFYRYYNAQDNAYDLTIVWGGFAAFAAYKVLGAFFRWYYNAIVMTNESLLFIYWKKLFHRNFSRIDFHNLDEIEVEKKGIRSFAWNYGTLRFQKINGGGVISISKINRPSRCARIIEKYREEILDNKNFTEESALKNLLSQMVQRHVGYNGQPNRDMEDMIRQAESKSRRQSVPLAPEKAKASKKSFFEKVRMKQAPKPEKERHFESLSIEVEKEFDDEGGIEFDLDR